MILLISAIITTRYTLQIMVLILPGHLTKLKTQQHQLQIIGYTSGTQFGYTDVDFSSYPYASYYVEAVMTSGDCNPTRSAFNTSISNVKNFGSVGVENEKQSIINIYPNPASDIINITG